MLVNANVILAKCKGSDKLYGMRVQEKDGDWIRTWAFRIKEEMARQEGFDKVEINGSFSRTAEYPGCPYCGATNFIVCGKCNKISCYNNEKISVCNWCGNSSKIVAKQRLDVAGGDF